MTHKFRLVQLNFFIAVLASCFTAQAYTVLPSCPDFTNINADYVEAHTGNTSNPFDKQGIVNGRHTLITAQGTDPNTGGALALLPPGENRVIRLGNEQVGAEAEALTYHFIVDRNNPVLLLKFAVVLEDPQHSIIQQPRFVVRITDKNGKLIEECAEYDVSAREGIPGFQTYQRSGYSSPVRWRDWTNVGLDMSSFIGQEVQVQFITYDCSPTAHFGYAYFTASCIPNYLRLEVCTGMNFTVEAPKDFESYLWDNSDTTRASTRAAAENNSSLSCLVTSATGCQFTLNAYVTSNPVSQITVIKDTICEGEAYTKNYFDLSAQYNIGTNTYYNAILNTGTCSTSQITELQLTVIQRYTRIKAAICGGEDYIGNGFNIINPAAGVRRDSLFLQSKNSKCDSIICLELTVSPSLSTPNVIAGDASICTDEPTIYSFAGAELLTNFSWNIPDNAIVVGKDNQPQIMLYFTDITPATLSLTGENGCGSGTVSLDIHPRQSHAVYFTDTICAGTEYNKHGFNLGIQNEIGYFAHTHDFKTTLGCDSSVTVGITVFPSLASPLIVGDTISCNPGEKITLLAMDAEMAHAFNPEMLKDSTFSYAYDCDIEYVWNTGKTGSSITEKPNVSTLYIVTATNSMGCSATTQQWVIVETNTPQTINETICKGGTYTKYELNVDETGTYPVSIVGKNCTIPVTVNLTVLPVYHQLLEDVACYGEPYVKHGLNVTPYEEGAISQTFHYQTTAGCDSLVTIQLLVFPEKTTTLRDTICQYKNYDKNGFMLPEQIFTGLQTYIKDFETTQGCDSTVMLQLFVKPTYTNIISDEVGLGETYKKYGFNFSNVTADLTETKQLQTSCGCDSTVILNLKAVEPPVYQAVNDTVPVTFCQGYIIADILANDSYPCSNPTITILNSTQFQRVNVMSTGDGLLYYPNFDIRDNYFGQTDSIHYSITCGSAVIDSAWVFFQYPSSLDPWIEIESKFNKNCFAVGDTIIEEIWVRYPEFKNCYTFSTYLQCDLSSPMATFSYIDYRSPVINDSTRLFQVYYKVLTINSGYENTIITNTAFYTISPMGHLFWLSETQTLDFALCEEMTMTDCESSRTFAVTHSGATAYRLSQRAQLAGAVDLISQDGIFSYTSPKVTDITRDSVRYEVDLQNGTTVGGVIFINIIPCIDSVRVESTMNEECNFDSCKYDGPSILINEVMIAPAEYDGAIYGYQCDPYELKGGEWIELYNPDKCNPVDISGYFLGNSTIDAPYCRFWVRDIGGGFLIPEGTIIPPMGFCVLRGEKAAKVDSVRLIENGGNTFVINLMDHFDRFCLDNIGNRFWLPNAGGWFGFYDRDGVPQDAIYWGPEDADICADCTPCTPQIPGYYSGNLVSLNDFPDNRKTRISDENVSPWIGSSPKRQPDGGNWTFNDFTPPTLGYCNGDCNTRADSDCNGTVMVQVHGGTGSFSYQWDDPKRQTTETATGLCEGIYYCTITDNKTGMSTMVRATVKINPESCPEVKAVNDMVSLNLCRDTVLRIPILKNDLYTCDEPEVLLLSAPILPGNTAQLVNDTLVFHFQHTGGRDSLQYKIICDGLKPAFDSAWVFIEVKKDAPHTEIPMTICQGDSVLFGKQYYKLPGIYTDTLKTALGCDSIVSLKLSVNLIIYQDTPITICQGDYIFFGKNYYHETGIYTDTLKTVFGCDSIVTLNLTVKQAPSVAVVEKTVCQNDTVHLTFTGAAPFELDYAFNGTRQKVTISGMETALVATQAGENPFILYELISGEGCSSSGVSEKGVEINGVTWATRNVDRPGTFTATPEEAGRFYQWGKKVGWSTTDPMINTNGDTNWDVNYPPNTGKWEVENDPCPCGWRVPTAEEQWDMIGEGSVDTIRNGTLGRLSRTDRSTVFLPYAVTSDGLIAGWRNADGSLQVFDVDSYYPHSDYWSSTSFSSTDAFDLCFRIGYPPLLEPVDKLFCPLIRCVKDVTRCPQINTIKVNPVYNDSPVERAICQGDSVFFAGKYYKQEGIYIETLKTVFGCDSIVTLDLKENSVYLHEHLHLTICQGDSIFFAGKYYKQEGIYIETLKTVFGCDSILTLELSVNPVYDYSPPVTETICQGDSVFFANKYYKLEGIYTETLKTVFGCDSIVTLDLRVNQAYFMPPVSKVICQGDSVFFENKYYKKTGIYTETLKTILGCDSILTLDLTVQDPPQIIITPSERYVCQDGEKKITLTAKVITGNPSEIVWYDDTRTPIQDGTGLKQNVMPLEHESTYWAYAADPVCGDSPLADTIVYVTNKVYLFLNADTTKVQIGDNVTLTVTPTNNEHGTYRWYDAFTHKLLGETTENTFTLTLDKAGSYAFYVLTDNGYCPEANSGKGMDIRVADYFMIPNIITPYNRNGMNDSFMTPSEDRPGYKVEIYNRYQQKVFEGDNGWDGMYRGRLAEPGTYFYRLFMKDGRILKGTIEVAKF